MSRSRARVSIRGWDSRFALLAGVLILASGCNQTAVPPHASGSLQHKDVSSDLDASWQDGFTLLERYVEQQMSDWALPGMALAVDRQPRNSTTRTSATRPLADQRSKVLRGEQPGEELILCVHQLPHFL